MSKQTMSEKVCIVSGDYDPTFTEQIAAHLDLPVTNSEVITFANGEINAKIADELRGKEVFIVQSHGSPVNDMLMSHRALISAAKRASAAKVTAINPYRAYGRADKPDDSHSAFMGPLVLRDLATSGAGRIIEVDPHAGQTAGFLPDFDTEYTPIAAFPAIRRYLEENIFDLEDMSDVVMVAPDSGRAKTNHKYAEHYNTSLAIVDKLRIGTNQIEANRLTGDVDGKLCIIIDDMIDTAGTITQGARVLREHGATEVVLVATHGILSGPAIERLSSAKSEGVIGRIAVTDTLLPPQDTPPELIDIISVAPMIAKVISRIYKGKSVSNMKMFR